jgi:hypothetical protein
LKTYFQAPDYQEQYSTIASVVYVYKKNYVNGQRGVPDVAASCVKNAIYCSVQATDGTCPGFMTEDGTSGATPLWAGIAADINQYLLSQGKATLGTASALLYEVYAKEGNAFHDIADGTSNGAYTAGPGYDLVTGMGSPDAWVLAWDLDALIQTNLESDVVWGQTQTDYKQCTTSTVDLMASYNQSSNPGWQKPIDVFTSFSNNVNGDPCPNLVTNAGQPAIISYPTQSDGTEVDVFALATDKNSSTHYIHGFIYLPASGTWTNLGPISQVGALQPEYNPAVVEQYTDPTAQPNQLNPNVPTMVLFGISSSGHVIEYYLANNYREYFGTPQLFNYRDISSVTGVSGCDPAITPAPVIYNTVPVVFADCNQELIEFYDNTNGQWRANTGLVGHDIPNASEAFPHHSIAAMVVPGSPGALEAYVASDQNGAKALSEYLYDGSAWHAYAVPTGGYTPDQLYAKTVIQANAQSATTISEVIAPEPATVSCSNQSYAVQHLYVSGGWQTTYLPTPGITTMQANESEYGTVLTEAYTGGYFGPDAFGSVGGGGCLNPNPGGTITEDGSTLATSGSQSWWSAPVDASGVDNAGVEPVTTAFPY